MYPDSMFNSTFYLIPEEGLPYDEQREIFSKMIDICKELTSDIGHADMLVQFDDEVKLTRAELALTEAKIKWQER